ncbi:MAG: GAF domain-containing protein, partial [Bacteroidota bacterium]
MRPSERSPDFTGWREIVGLGEQLAVAGSLAEQRDLIVAVTSRLLRGRIDVWLNESLFRLPDWDAARTFPARPRLDGMRRALRRKKLYIQRAARQKGSRKASVALPLEDQGLLFGALQVTRPSGPDFTLSELEILSSVGREAAMGLFAALRLDVERFRLRQLTLVRDVSAQIATVMQTDELARRVTELIQKTFHYYYVAIFTLSPGATRLRFRASAQGPRRGGRQAPLAFEVALGQGLIG